MLCIFVLGFYRAILDFLLILLFKKILLYDYQLFVKMPKRNSLLQKNPQTFTCNSPVTQMLLFVFHCIYSLKKCINYTINCGFFSKVQELTFVLCNLHSSAIGVKRL